MHIAKEQPLAYVLAGTNHGPMIVNRFDFHATGDEAYGVGGQLLQTASYQPHEITLALGLLQSRRTHFGDGVVAIDGGANIGVHTVEWARLMTGWGHVIAVEAQERIFYALAGNIAINNCFNAHALCAVLSSEVGTCNVPVLDYQSPASFGSLEIHEHPENEDIGQPVNYSNTISFPQETIDNFNLDRLDFLKLDIQRMEIEALDGAKRTIAKFNPIILIEKVDVGSAAIGQWLRPYNYRLLDVDNENLLAIHANDPTRHSIEGLG